MTRDEKISSTHPVTSASTVGAFDEGGEVDKHDIHIGPSDHVLGPEDRK